MGSKIITVLSGIGLLIFVFLLLSRGDETVDIIKTIADSSVSGIRTLQGRF